MRHRHLIHAALIASVALSSLVGCRTPAPAKPQRTNTPDILLEEDLQEWQRRAMPQSDAEITFARDTFAFDHFVLTPETSIEQIWLVLHPTLGWLANHERGKPAELGFLALMNELEPMASGYDSPTRMEVSFLQGVDEQNRPSEALGLRLWRQIGDRTPTLSVVLWKDAARQGMLSSMYVWAHPDVERAASSALITDTDAIIAPEISSPDALHALLASSPHDTSHEASLLPLAHGMLWTQFADTAYVDSPLRPAAKLSPEDRHAGLKAALGLPVREREIDEVLPDTSFMPYVDVDDMFAAPR